MDLFASAAIAADVTLFFTRTGAATGWAAKAATLLIDGLVAGRGDIDLTMRLPETVATEIADLQRSINTCCTRSALSLTSS